MMEAATLTPTLSRKREREWSALRETQDCLTPTLSRKREREEHGVAQNKGAGEDPGSLSRLRERARVRARSLRQSRTDAEALLWSRLRDRRLLDLKFRRQRPIGKYIADFACVEIGLVIELDGGQHVQQATYDLQREKDMEQLGFRTLRFWDHEVLTETEVVMEKIWRFAQTLTPTLSRKRERE